MQRIARKVAEFVAMIRSLSLSRTDKSLYDFGLEVATRSGILAHRAENTPGGDLGPDISRSLLNPMQEFHGSAVTPRSATASGSPRRRRPSRSGCRDDADVGHGQGRSREQQTR